jgi:hypothetical protein
MKPLLTSLVAIALVAGLAYGLFTLMENAIPAGQALPVVVKLLNDPSDLSPREPNPPRGSHRDDFVSNCTACHSVRLTLTQPNLPAAKWTEVVQKMVTVYGAKIEKPQSELIVKYLAEVKGVN